MAFVETMSTGFGGWSPLFWILAFAVSAITGWLIWRRGESSCKTGTEQEKPYLCGNKEPEKGDVHVRAGNMYWGFTEAMKGYYEFLIPLHTGILTDYILWFLGVIAVMLVLAAGVF
ncbi:MAG: hydrogenase [Methanomicrobium sp.]|nr:hydrogenase [Methanomicrobium sp.]MDD4300257.1 hydrogenase [Methanomicrobium sp.]